MTVPFQHGYNDDFQRLAQSSPALPPDTVFQYLRDGLAGTIRCNIAWGDVQHTSDPTAWDFSSFVPLAQKAAANGLKVLPVLTTVGAWVPGGEPNQYLTPGYPAAIPPVPGTPYPGPAYIDDFAVYAVKTLQFLDTYGVATGVEVWNEPNIINESTLARVGTNMPVGEFSPLLGTVISHVKAANDNHQFSQSMTVVSGGLYRDGSRKWVDYLGGFVNQCYSYGLGIHPYGPVSFSGTWQDAADATSARVIARYDEVIDTLQFIWGISIQDVWVTETGCSYKSPWGLSGQARALASIVNGLRQRSRCKSMLVHRFISDPVHEGVGKPFYDYGVIDDTGVRNLGYFQLAGSWGT
ncbi:MAG: hypothetical protein U0R52_00930 [Solirubrobacterales bacterium]